MNSENFNISSLLSEAARRWPDRAAVIAKHRPDVLGRGELSYRELDESSSHLAQRLIQGGVIPGTRIVVLVGPGIDFMTIIFGLFKAGVVPVMADPGMGFRRMLRCLAEGSPAGIIGIPLAHLLSLAAPGYFRGIKVRVTIGRRLGWGGLTLSEIMKSSVQAAGDPDGDDKTQITSPPAPEAGAGFKPVDTKAKDMAAILFTSGATGPAKGVVYTHAMFKAQVEAIRDGLDISEGGVDLATFPLFGLFSPALGLTSVIPDINPAKPAQVDPRRIMEPIIRYGVTSMFASPTLLDKVSRFALEHNLTLPSLKRVISAGAPVSPRVAAAFVSLMVGDSKLLTPYGATEGVPLSRIDAEEITGATKAMTERGLGMCVGRALPGVSLKIIRILDRPISTYNQELNAPMGEIGEIIAQGPMVAQSYFLRPNDTAMTIIPDPDDPTKFWRRMGDVGWMDEGGRLWFCGRKNHRVISDQGTLFSIPCEAVFNNHPQVRRSALVGVGPPGQQRPVIIIEIQSTIKGKGFDWNALVEELTALGKANPRTINITTFLRYRCAFPVDVRHNAKINREKLAKWASKELKKSNGSKRS